MRVWNGDQFEAARRGRLALPPNVGMTVSLRFHSVRE